MSLKYGTSGWNLQYLSKLCMARTRRQEKPAASPQQKAKAIAKDSLDLPVQKSKGKRKAKEVQIEPHQRAVEDEFKKSLTKDFKLELLDGIYSVKLHNQTFEVKADHSLYKSIETLFTLFLEKQEKTELQLHKIIPHSNFPVFEFILRGEKPQEERCSICQFEFEDAEDYSTELKKESDEDVIILSCSHLIHRNCLTMLKGDKQWIKCPVCSTIYGVMVGDQPPGSMTWSVQSFMHCDGYPDVGTIVINYSMNAGKRGPISFPGTHRTGYLPDNKEGNEVLLLLVEAFNRKLIFTIGRSVTTGQDNRIVWNGIHHKTNTSGGSAYFGYPDDTYFQRVKLELAAKGIQ